MAGGEFRQIKTVKSAISQLLIIATIQTRVHSEAFVVLGDLNYQFASLALQGVFWHLDVIFVILYRVRNLRYLRI